MHDCMVLDIAVAVAIGIAVPCVENFHPLGIENNIDGDVFCFTRITMTVMRGLFELWAKKAGGLPPLLAIRVKIFRTSFFF